MRNRILAILIVCILTFVMTLDASSINDKKQELKDTQQSMQEAENQIEANESQIKNIEAEVSRLDKELIAAEEAVVKVEMQLEAKEAEIEETQELLEEAIQKKDYQYEATKKRMVQMYKNSKSGYMEMIFSSNNLSELLTRSKYIKIISEYDNQLLVEYQEQERLITEHSEVLAEEEKELGVLLETQIVARETVESKRSEKNRQIQALDKQNNALEAELAEIGRAHV